MKRAAAFLLVLGLVAAGAGLYIPSGLPNKKSAFCPECWKFLTEPGDLDSAGRCSVSGKRPVDVEAVTVTWYWCLPHQSWHRRPCGKDFSNPFVSVALLVPVGSEPVSVHAYCPGDRTISDLGHEGLKCPVCGRPFVGAETVEQRWYWCGRQKAWLTQPCSANQNLLVCCTPRKGPVLAYPWQVPLLSEVSWRGNPQEEMRVDAEWLAAHLDDPNLVVIHVGFDPTDPATSTRSGYFRGHIQGARHMAWGEIAITRKGIPNEMPPAESLVQMVRSLGLTTEHRIVLYDTGFGVEAARAYLTLDYLGLGKNAALLDGQWARWKAMKLPESRMPEEVEPSAFVPELHPEILVSYQAMKDLAWLSQETGSQVVLLDARSAEEYTGFRAGRGILRPGHIPGATNFCWELTQEPMADPVLRFEPELRALFEALGARPGKTVVAYCRTGTEASLLYFAAKYLGYQTKFYDGSYYEWSREDQAPVESNWAKR